MNHSFYVIFASVCILNLQATISSESLPIHENSLAEMPDHLDGKGMFLGESTAIRVFIGSVIL